MVAVAAWAQAAAPDVQPPTVTPYRPTLSDPAGLPVPGWLEGEFGGLRVLHEDGSRSDTVPFLLKYAFDEDHGVLFGGDAFDREVDAAGPHGGGMGDTYLEWKQRLPMREGLAFGYEIGPVLPTSAQGVGLDKPAWLLNGILSSGVGALHLDINVGATRYATRSPGASRWQSGWAAAMSWPLGDRFGGAIELSGNNRRGIGHAHQMLGTANFMASRRLVWDAGLAYGLDRRTHDLGLFAGGTVLLGRLR
ncbi:MAG: hypothetical protein ABFC67_12195 [Mizugakiibacter sp.]|uniref:hypothetical protein n=1 Tax=Mizugakiibacter sp. TaxID=1972610 RepID=UPI0031C4BA6F|nr:hypothetical protein [Xanthomonadaceae bacterium]